MSAEHGVVTGLKLLQQATVTTTSVSTGVDCSALDGIVTVAISGTICGAGASNAIKVRHCATQGGSYVDVPGAAIAQGVNAVLLDAVQFDINGLDPWIIVSHTVSGTYSSAICATIFGRTK
ncbi:MAG: hypothetical protein D4R80_06555 [Deltaproteobacteria bacterium]|nr:MAG: hypothetical protein D4R80_06555 [Deltaproteobacteria bacterium]